jgi:hypothetical protein
MQRSAVKLLLKPPKDEKNARFRSSSSVHSLWGVGVLNKNNFSGENVQILL